MTWLWFVGPFSAHRFAVDERGIVYGRAACGHRYERGRPWAEGDAQRKCRNCESRESVMRRAG